LEFYVNVVYIGLWWSNVAPFDDFVDSYLITFKDCFHASVRQVAHPSSDFMSRGHMLCVLPEVDALDPAAYKDVSAGLSAAHFSVMLSLI